MILSVAGIMGVAAVCVNALPIYCLLDGDISFQSTKTIFLLYIF